MKFTHLRLDNRIVGTVATTVIKNKTVVRWAVVGWNPIDPFSKEYGRVLARDAMKTRPEKVGTWNTREFPVRPNLVRFDLMTAIVSDKGLPTNVRKAAKEWIKKHTKLQEEITHARSTPVVRGPARTRKSR
jgi:hypothetical protein